MPAITYGSQFEAKLRERAELERRRVLAEIEGGEAIQSFEIYRERVGYLRALRELDEWCTDVTSDLEKG